jgi:hypothetical protein
LKNISATRAVTSTLGVLVGLAGIEHGFFEMLQGNITPSSMMIEAIGPAQRFWANIHVNVCQFYCNQDK